MGFIPARPVAMVDGQKGVSLMKAPCTLSRMPTGGWLVRHSSSTLGNVEVSAASREEALTKMRDELQYRIEWCPCSGASGDTVELQVREEGGRKDQPGWRQS